MLNLNPTAKLAYYVRSFEYIFFTEIGRLSRTKSLAHEMTTKLKYFKIKNCVFRIDEFESEA